MNAISAFQVERAMSAAQSFAEQLRATDQEMDGDTLLLALDSETDVMDVLRRVVRASLDADAMADAVSARIADMQQRRDRFTARKAAARSLAQAMLEALGLPKLEEPDFTISIGKPRPKVLVTDLDALPEAFVRTTRAADMAQINAAAKAGQLPPGCELSNGSPTLTIRTK